MKKSVLVLIITFLLIFGCSKQGVIDVKYKISYTNKADTQLNNLKSAPVADGYYTQFGDYITSVTPRKFIAKFNGILFRDRYTTDLPYLINIIDGGNMPNDDPRRYADFSKNNSFEVTPTMNGNISGDGWFVDHEITFPYFIFTAHHFYQEIELPVQYKNIELMEFTVGEPPITDTMKLENVQNGNILSLTQITFMDLLFPDAKLNTYVFGNTDSTFLHHVTSPEPDINNPGGSESGGGDKILRSHKFTPFVLVAPAEGETRTLLTTLNFYTDDLIHIYAGIDNTPYTFDDIVIYAPNFWERFSVKVDYY